jgi:hypothetical protein
MPAGVALGLSAPHSADVPLPDGFTYRPRLFDDAEVAAHLAGLLAEIAWERHAFSIYGRSVPMPRLIASKAEACCSSPATPSRAGGTACRRPPGRSGRA